EARDREGALDAIVEADDPDSPGDADAAIVQRLQDPERHPVVRRHDRVRPIRTVEQAERRAMAALGCPAARDDEVVAQGQLRFRQSVPVAPEPLGDGWRPSAVLRALEEADRPAAGPGEVAHRLVDGVAL